MTNRISEATEFEVGYAIGFLSAQKEQFSTIDIIRKIIGSYYCDVETPGGSSPNALFGKRLSANEHLYRIKRIPPDVPSKGKMGVRSCNITSGLTQRSTGARL